MCALGHTTKRRRSGHFWFVEQLVPDHPICRGWEPYELRDEFYLNLKYAQAAQPVLKVNVDGIDQTVAWAYDRPESNGGRSFGTTLAHFHDNFAIPAFRRAIVNGILWTAHVEVPENGCPSPRPDDDAIEKNLD